MCVYVCIYRYILNKISKGYSKPEQNILCKTKLLWRVGKNGEMVNWFLFKILLLSLLYRTIWDNPTVFRPERFLNENGELNKSLTEKVLIFGMGIRKCLAEDLSRNEIFVFITTVLQHLELKKCPGAELDMTPIYGLSTKPKPYQLQAVPRFPGSWCS